MSVSINRRAWLWLPALAAALLVATPALTSAQPKEDKKQKEKQSKEQREEAQALVKLVDAAMKGQAAPADFAIRWHNDFMKATAGKVYIPFTLSIDPATIANRQTSLYVRVVSKAQPQGTPAPVKRPPVVDPESDEPPPPPPPPIWPFEDIHLIELKAPASGQPYRVSRAFAVPGGEYDVYLAMRERKADKQKVQRTTVQKQTLTVPDYWNGQLTTSTVILADAVQPRTTTPSLEEQLEKPYLIGAVEIVPAADGRFTKAEELSIFFLVYNPVLKEKKPDVTIEYKFHQKTAEGDKYFNRTQPTLLNASTLPPTFDFDLGHQLVAGQSIPLASFPEGEYRLEIEVVDNLGQKKLTREVFFTVAGS
jgi:hypothetical protein